MAAKSKLRGGTDSARAKGLKGVVVYFTPEDRKKIGVAAQTVGKNLRKWLHDIALEQAENNGKKE